MTDKNEDQWVAELARALISQYESLESSLLINL